MTSNKEKYRQFCETETDLPIFMQHWWLDAVCGDGWDVVIYEEKNKVIGVFPYPFKKKYFFRTILRPELTPWLGPWVIIPKGLSVNDKIKFEQKVHLKLIEQLPDFDWLNIDCNPTFANWKTFHWNEFKQTTKYTSILEKKCTEDEYFRSLDKITRKRIRKATERYIVENDYDFYLIKDFFKRPFERQGLNFRFTDEFLENLFSICEIKSCMEVFCAKNKQTGITESVNFCIWDSKYYYLILSGGDDLSRTNYANYLLTYLAIKSAWDKGLVFNFEGSMLKAVDSFNLKFKPKLLHYFNLSKISSRYLRFCLNLQ